MIESCFLCSHILLQIYGKVNRITLGIFGIFFPEERWTNTMKRKEFLEQVIVSTFDVKGIEYLNTTDGVVQYNKGVTVYRDCTYSYSYKMKFNDF